MIQSMTGFGKSSLNFSDKKINIQLKSLNSKRFDLYTRIPTEYREKEVQFQKLISEYLERGKVDFSLNLESFSGETSTKINQEVVKNYISELQAMVSSGDELDFLKIAVKLPDSLHTPPLKVDKEEYQAIEDALKEALENLIEFRKEEGQALEKDFRIRIQNLQDLLNEVAAMDKDRIAETRNRLREAIEDLKVEIDENRFEQELVYYLEKYDITEEKTRLQSHLDYFMKTLDATDSNGRKLGFISQEIGREINTIGSKSNHAPMQKYVVKMKDELEKIKEQLLNVL